MSLAHPDGEDWVGLTTSSLPTDAVLAWAVRDDTGALVSFCGTVRDHSEGREQVTALDYEAYEDQVVPQLARIVEAARKSWPDLGRVACLHRIGHLHLGEVSVLVAASSPHRDVAFDAARYLIDTVKASVPIWKRETFEGGSAWALDAHELVELDPVPSAKEA